MNRLEDARLPWLSLLWLLQLRLPWPVEAELAGEHLFCKVNTHRFIFQQTNNQLALDAVSATTPMFTNALIANG
jgi:hypothetical protein